MKKRSFLLALGFVSLLSCLPAQSLKPEASQQIDAVLAKTWADKKITPNPVAPDEVFLRRIYLDAVGRIPTYLEAQAFLNDRSPNKRGQLIDKLLSGEGYVSHMFNYFSDLLRLKNNGGNGAASAMAYANYVKESLRANKPYNLFVKELLSGSGYCWEAPTVGYYLRDPGMPLDNLAATTQVFLGTQMVCAQCHDHPFDKWTQMDYYQLAAFTYGVDTQKQPINIKDILQQDGMEPMKGKGKAKGKGKNKDKDEAPAKPDPLVPAAKSLTFNAPAPSPAKPAAATENRPPLKREDYRMVAQTLVMGLQNLRFTSAEYNANKALKLPKDYQYDNGKPNELVKPAFILGHNPDALPGETKLDSFARWVTDAKNPRFTTVIANRLWKKVFGIGLIEPVDEFTDNTVASIPELQALLDKTMLATNYNLKSYLRILFNTDAYQRLSVPKEEMDGVAYYFPGPVLRRMSAEQVWDSFVTLITGDPDERNYAQEKFAEARLDYLKTTVERLEKLTKDDLTEIAYKIKDSKGGANGKTEDVRKQIAEAREKGDTATVRKLLQQANSKRADAKRLVNDVLGLEDERTMMKEAYQTGAAVANPKKADKAKAKGGGRKVGAGFAQFEKRASDLPSPAPNGHFLREFGQSDRDTIENANDDASVPQALSLLNGPIFNALIAKDSSLSQTLASAKTDDEGLDILFLSVFSRKPVQAERDMLKAVIPQRGAKAWEDIFYAVLNARQYLFIQ